jgi:hypothetical protein
VNPLKILFVDLPARSRTPEDVDPADLSTRLASQLAGLHTNRPAERFSF